MKEVQKTAAPTEENQEQQPTEKDSCFCESKQITAHMNSG